MNVSPLTALPSRTAARALRRAVAVAATAGAALLAAPGAGAADDVIVVIVNKGNLHAVDTALVLRLYTGAIKGWPDGTPVLVYDQPEESDAHDTFCTTVLRRSVHNVKAIWSQNIFTGKGLPPKVAAPDATMKRLVAANRLAIGYIRASQVDDTVRVVLR